MIKNIFVDITCSASICPDEQYSISYKPYFGEDAVSKMIRDMIAESIDCQIMLERTFNKPFITTEKVYEDFEKSTKYCSCKKQFKKESFKVKDHYPVTEKYRLSAHIKCNLKFNLTVKFMLRFIICKL